MLDTPFGFSRREALKLTAVLVLILLGCGIAIGIVLGVCQALHVPAPPVSAASSPAFIIVANTLTFAFGLGYGLWRMQAPWRDLFRSRWAGAKVYAVMFLAFLGMIAISSELSNALVAIAPLPTFISGTLNALTDTVTYPITGPILLLVVAPVTEELFFRGLILRRLLAVTSPSQAIWTSALLFMVFHLNPWQFPAALVIGLLVGWLYARTRSLGLCIAAHALNNGASLFAGWLPFQVKGFNTTPIEGVSVFQPWWFDLAGVALLLGGVYLLSRITPAILPRPIPVEPPILQEPTPPAPDSNTRPTDA